MEIGWNVRVVNTEEVKEQKEKTSRLLFQVAMDLLLLLLSLFFVYISIQGNHFLLVSYNQRIVCFYNTQCPHQQRYTAPYIPYSALLSSHGIDRHPKSQMASRGYAE